jgi:hypothetical protein
MARQYFVEIGQPSRTRFIARKPGEMFCKLLDGIAGEKAGMRIGQPIDLAVHRRQHICVARRWWLHVRKGPISLMPRENRILMPAAGRRFPRRHRW